MIRQSSMKIFAGASLLMLALATAAHAQAVSELPADSGMAAEDDGGSTARFNRLDAMRPGDQSEGKALLSLSLEELLASEVTSVAKKPQSSTDSPAAVYVISQDDIARSTAKTVYDLLKMVPGLDVVEATPTLTSVSARGFDSTYSVDMLVMIDGAAIYSSSIAGMFWDQALVPLQDIERIEVIRGPGGTLWGSNSVNGIINIITKQAIDTQGLRADVKAGTTNQRAEFGYARQLSETLSARAYGTYLYDRGLDGTTGHDFTDWRQAGLFGVRLDAAPTTADSVVTLAEIERSTYRDVTNDLVTSPGYGVVEGTDSEDFRTYHTLARWHHTASNALEYSLQGYYNRFERTIWGSYIARDLSDVSGEGRWRASKLHEFNFGLGGRISHDVLSVGDVARLFDGAHTDRWLNGYAQDELHLVGDALRLTVGSKFEYSNFKGFIAQPSARLFWRANPALAAWGSVTAAARTPQLRERDMEARFPGYRDWGNGMVLPTIIDFKGVSNATSERLMSYEGGLRASLGPHWLLDITGYYNRYTHLNTADVTSVTPVMMYGVPYTVGMVINAVISDQARGRSFGGEMLLKGHPVDGWTTELSWSYLDLNIYVPPAYAAYASPVLDEGPSARHQIRWKNSVDLSEQLSADASVHYVSPSYDHARAAYTALDARLGWHPRPNLEVALLGANLLKPRTVEFVQALVPSPTVAVPRRVNLEARVRF